MKIIEKFGPEPSFHFICANDLLLAAYENEVEEPNCE
jgi:hypothetical protein